VKFGHQVQNAFPYISIIGIFKLMFVEREILIRCKQWNEDFNPFSFSLMLGNPGSAT